MARSMAIWAAMLVAAAIIAGGAAADGAFASSPPRHARGIATLPPGVFRDHVEIAASYTDAGDPSLVANFAPNGTLATPSFETCEPGRAPACKPAKPGQFLTPGSVPSGTVFEARATFRGRTYEATTAIWDGTVRSIAVPSLIGRFVVGGRVTAHRGRWAGGWRSDPSWNRTVHYSNSAGRGPDFDQLQVEACRTKLARHCLTISAPDQGYTFSNSPPIPSRVRGWYLFAFDTRYAYDTVFAGVGRPTPEDVPPLRVGATISRSAPFGPVT